MSAFELIVEELKTLPEAKLRVAAEYIHRLVILTKKERETMIQETSGIWNSEDADAVEKAINEGCERIDVRDW